MSKGVEVRFAAEQYELLHGHLFPGDDREHAAVALASLVQRDGRVPTLLVREILPARDGDDYGVSPQGHGRLSATFINKAIVQARNKRLVYLHIHNHASDRSVAFSDVDLASHERGYPALLDIVKGMPVGGLVLGRRSMQLDLWWPSREREHLKVCKIVGPRIQRLYASPREIPTGSYRPSVDRQVLFLGAAGQAQLQSARIAVVGLGGVGSMVVQDLSRLGVGELVLIDSDRLEESNLSRVVTATHSDIAASPPKTDLASRYARAVNPHVKCEAILDDVAFADVADRLVTCDFIFLCADTMRARLVVNALVNQHLIPGVQIGSKIVPSKDGSSLEHFYSVVRQMRPGRGCMWCNGLISASRLAIEEKSEDDWRAQNYGTESPNPSVITLNGIGASRASHDFLLDFVATDLQRPDSAYSIYDVTKAAWLKTNLRRDLDCTECSADEGSRFARGDAVTLPCRERRA